jgi:hypothetical protein
MSDRWNLHGPLCLSSPMSQRRFGNRIDSSGLFWGHRAVADANDLPFQDLWISERQSY